MDVSFEILCAVVAACTSPFIVANLAQWKQSNKERKFNAIENGKRQDKLEELQKNTAEKINQMAAALNSLSQALVSTEKRFTEETEKWEDTQARMLKALRTKR